MFKYCKWLAMASNKIEKTFTQIHRWETYSTYCSSVDPGFSTCPHGRNVATEAIPDSWEKSKELKWRNPPSFLTNRHLEDESCGLQEMKLLGKVEESRDSLDSRVCRNGRRVCQIKQNGSQSITLESLPFSCMWHGYTYKVEMDTPTKGMGLWSQWCDCYLACLDHPWQMLLLFISFCLDISTFSLEQNSL